MQLTARRTDWIIGLLAFVVVLLASETVWMRAVEYLGYDAAMRWSPSRKASPDVVVVAIDDNSVARLGPWPWNRDILASAQRQLIRASPRAVAYTISFEAAHNERGLEIMGEFRNQHGELMSSRLRRLLQRAVNRLDTDHSLANSIRDSGNVLLAYPYTVGRLGGSATLGRLPAVLRGQTLRSTELPQRYRRWPQFLKPPGILPAERLFPPTAKIGSAAAALAADVSYVSDQTGVRATPLAVRYGDRLLPTLPLRAYLAWLGGRSMHADADGVDVGGESVVTDDGLRVHPYFYPPRDGASPFKVLSFVDLLAEDVPSAALRGKLVLIGLTARRFADTYPTPLGTAMPPVMITAHVLSSLIQGDLLHSTRQHLTIRLLVLGLVAGYLILVLPRLRSTTGVAVSGLVAVLVLNAQFLLMVLQSSWVPMMNALVLLVVGHALIFVNHLVVGRVQRYQRALSDSNRLLARTLQAQGQLDDAFTKYRQCVATEEVIGLLYSLGLDFERKRQFNKAADVFRYLAAKRRRYRDIEARLKKNVELDSRLVLGMDARNNAVSTLIITDDGIQKPTLGRYQVDKEIGRGAMGMVYLGRDPKIGRTVAIKTMAFDQEFDADNVEAVKQRFFREAETAGRLNHPNIVTIYDVGEEQDLSYIAMDFIEGAVLSRYATKDKLLPLGMALHVAAQVADALHYAHLNRVVHRDVKPGNIIFDPQSGHTTVTDFGVACLTDASRTKSGTILGSPSYMSPEQLSGNRVDGRADLFSLGVTIFEIVTGELPFVADSLSSLMFRIANERHVDPRTLREDLPACVRTLIDRALQKSPDKRYRNGAQMATAIRRCAEKAASGTGSSSRGIEHLHVASPSEL